MRLTDRWRTASRTQRMVLIGIAAAMITVLAAVPAALTSSSVDQRLDQTESKMEDDIAEATAELQSRLNETSAENERLRAELATIVALLEQVPQIGDRIGEIRDMQARDLAGEDDRTDNPPPPPPPDRPDEDSGDPPPEPDEPDDEPPDDPDEDDPPPPQPSPSPEEPSDPLQDALDDLLNPDDAVGHTGWCRTEETPWPTTTCWPTATATHPVGSTGTRHATPRSGWWSSTPPRTLSTR